MKLLLGIPIFDTVQGEVYESHLNLMNEIKDNGFDVTVSTPLGICPYDRARNAVMEHCNDDIDLLLFVDGDILLPKKGFLRLLEAMRDTKAQAVSGHYYRRGYPYTCVWSQVLKNTNFHVDADSGVHEIHRSGLGCCLIDAKWVRDNLASPYFKYDSVIGGGEDTYFFDLIREAGGKVVGHADVRCGHVGTRFVVSDKTVNWVRENELKHQLRGEE